MSDNYKKPPVAEHLKFKDAPTAPNTALLSDEMKDKLRTKAKGVINKERQEQEEDIFFDNVLQEERINSLKSRGLYSEDEIVPIVIDLAPHANAVTLDGRSYFHGAFYELPRRIYDTVRDIAARTWDHEDQTGGANRDHYRRPRDLKISPGAESRKSSDLLRI